MSYLNNFTADLVRPEQNTKYKSIKLVARLIAIFGIVIGFILFAVFGVITLIFYGPSPAARDLLVNTVMETSAAQFIAHMYFTDTEIDEIIKANTPQASTTVTDGSGVVLSDGEDALDLSLITIEDVSGPTFVGKMMIVNDPSRIFIHSLPKIDEKAKGQLLTKMIETTGAVAGINGGGFYDPNGTGGGGMPVGTLIKGGRILSDTETKHSTIIGFDKEHKLIVGDMTATQAIAIGVQDAVSFGPALIINGERMPITGTGGGLNPRTAIGQTSDGRILMLVIDGRQPHSLGASYTDVAEVMMDYKAVNAANLDGGSSSMMVHEGEILNTFSAIIGQRYIPTAFLIKPPEKSGG